MEQRITFKLQSEDKERLKAFARASGLSISPYLRLIILEKLREAKPIRA